MVAEWQCRPLDRVYPIVFLDAIHFKVRQENRIVNKAAYSVLGITMSGHKDILGIWIGEHESASFWLNVCTELKSRGVEDILIACKDGLSGFSEAIHAAFPKTQIQLCVIHQIRNSMKYVPFKEEKLVLADLKKVYQALTLEEAETAFFYVQRQVGKEVPHHYSLLGKQLARTDRLFQLSPEIRKMIYTTNIIEGYHRQLRKVTKTKRLIHPTMLYGKSSIWLPLRHRRNGLCRFGVGKNVYRNLPSILEIDCKGNCPHNQLLSRLDMEPLRA
nr:IS256 family transposase [Brevibacillus sp. HD3.3A]